jgi:hypothetical protein
MSDSGLAAKKIEIRGGVAATALTPIGADGLKVSRGATGNAFEFKLSTCAPSVPSDTARTM